MAEEPDTHVQDDESGPGVRLLPLVRHRAEHLKASQTAEAHQQPVDVHDVLGSLRLNTEDPESRDKALSNSCPGFKTRLEFFLTEIYLLPS